MKKTLQNLSLLFLSLVFFFTLGEIATRVFWKRSDNFFQSDLKIGRIHIPNKEGIFFDEEFFCNVKINSQGFIGKDYPLQKEPGTFRIVVLGDSMTEAMQVPSGDNFCGLLESRLSQEGVKADVINLGVSGFGTGREFLTLKHYGLPYQPDLAILAFTISNDIANNYVEDENNPSFVVGGGENKIKSFLAKNFRLAQYIREKSYSSVPLRNFLGKLGILSESKRVEKDAGLINSVPSGYFVYARDYPDFLKQGWEKTAYFLDKIKQMTDEQGIRFLVVFLPAQEQLYGNVWQEIRETYPAMEEMEWNLEKPNELLKARLEESEISYFDLYPLIGETLSNSGQSLYYKYDGHLNQGGHKIISQFLGDYILSNYFD